MELIGFDPIKRAEAIRPRMIDLVNKKVLIASFEDTSQLKDIPQTQRMGDHFRVKIYTKRKEIEQGLDNFRREPAAIAAERLGEPPSYFSKEDKRNWQGPRIAECNAVFLGQINGCNLRCWQCYVDDRNNSANPEYGKFFSAEEILIQFLIESRKAQFLTDSDRKLNILRISGGDPFLVPEIIVWMIEAVQNFGLEDFIYLWVDTNLTVGDFYWKYLSDEQRTKIRNFKNIGFMGCYKGYDEESFTKTCGAAPKFLQEQFKTHRRLIEEGLDVYTYLYPLTYSEPYLREKIIGFMNKLQKEINKYAPLRLTTPCVKKYSPTEMRLTPERERALVLQYPAIEIWKQEIERRFGEKANLAPHEISVR